MILVFGRNGQLAQCLFEKTQSLKEKIQFLGSDEADFMNPSQVLEQMEKHQPTKVIVCSAYTKVDLAESEKEKCFQINTETPKLLAKKCADKNIPMLIFSTDYVFDGSGTQPWQETASTSPLNTYGKSKELMEQAVLQASSKHTVVRTSWVFSKHGSNFVKTILRLAKEKPELKIVNDQVGAPTSAELLADFCVLWIQNPVGGLFHLTNEGFVSWCEFAKEIVKKLTKQPPQIIGIPSSDYPTPAKRPLNSRLDCAKIYKIWPELRKSFKLYLEV